LRLQAAMASAAAKVSFIGGSLRCLMKELA